MVLRSCPGFVQELERRGVAAKLRAQLEKTLVYAAKLFRADIAPVDRIQLSAVPKRTRRRMASSRESFDTRSRSDGVDTHCSRGSYREPANQATGNRP